MFALPFDKISLCPLGDSVKINNGYLQTIYGLGKLTRSKARYSHPYRTTCVCACRRSGPTRGPAYARSRTGQGSAPYPRTGQGSAPYPRTGLRPPMPAGGYPDSEVDLDSYLDRRIATRMFRCAAVFMASRQGPRYPKYGLYWGPHPQGENVLYFPDNRPYVYANISVRETLRTPGDRISPRHHPAAAWRPSNPVLGHVRRPRTRTKYPRRPS